MKKLLLMAVLGLSFGMEASNANLPQGSYLESCRMIQYDGKTLIAWCDGYSDYRNFYQYNKIECKLTDTLGNDNGNLFFVPVNLPKGNYLIRNWCINCTYKGGILTGDCYTGGEGSPRKHTSLNYKGGFVHVDNGNLVE